MPEAAGTDVLVIGLGPMGATTALALATYGIRVQAVSHWNWVANTPRAHITNQRTVEVLRDLGVEEDAKRVATPWGEMGDTLFTTSLAGPEIARLRTWGTGDDRFGDYLCGSPCTNLDLPQPLLEPILVNHAAARGARIAFNVEYLHSVQDADGVTATLQDRLTGRQFTQRAAYLVGADGARSGIAAEIGLPMVGEMARAGTVYAQFKADLARYVAHRPSILHWVMNPSGGFGEIGMGLLRAVRPWTEWIAGWGFDMAQGEPDLRPETALAKIRALVGDPDLACDLVSVVPWYVNRSYAEHYSIGRVFCGGDAVHRHPPSSGLGSNTSIQDGFNLAWKLAMVLKGQAGPGLLDSYTLERAPVGRQVVERANRSRVEYAALRACFATTGSADPVAAGLAKIKASTAEGAAVRMALKAALALKDQEFNAHGTELNQRYASAAVITKAGAAKESWRRDRGLYLQASTRPGAKLPHAWLVGRDGVRVSTLDLVGRGQFTLMTGLSGMAWREAAAAVAAPSLRLVVVGEDGAADPYCVWADASETAEAGVLLIRPDGYVAWRVQEAVWDAAEATELLRSALERILSLEAGTKQTIRTTETNQMKTLLTAAIMGACIAAATPAAAQFAHDTIKVGVLTDMSGPISTYNGPGSVMAARMAIEEFGTVIDGHRIELVSADHQNKPDLGSAIARQWFAVDHVDAVADLASSAVGLAVVGVAAPLGKVVLATGVGSSDFVGRACSATSVLWSWDTYSIANATVGALVGPGADKWYFITSDYAFGRAFEAAARAAVERGGGRVIGSVKTPIGTTDFSALLLQAQQSGANVVSFATSGIDNTNVVKQAGEFGLARAGLKVVPLQLLPLDIKGIGLEQAQGTITALPFYHDQSPAAAAWSRRFLERFGSMPSQNQAGTYSAVRAYLQAVKDAGTTDGPAVIARMRATPVNDAFTSGGVLREDGLMVHDDWLVRVKTPAESTGPWDLASIVKQIPGASAYQKLGETGCVLPREAPVR